MAVIGYARVSSTGQSLEIQTDKLKNFGCEKIFKEKISGVTENRKQLNLCLDYIREEDQLVITKLDRLARSTFHLIKIANLLKNKKVDLIVIDQNINTNTNTGKLLFNILATIAEFEYEIRKERQLEGIEKAKKAGIKFGPKPKLNTTQINQLKNDKLNGLAISELMNKYNISRDSVYRMLRT